MTTSTFEPPGPTAQPSTRSRRGLRLFPREEAFFDLFAADAANVRAGAQRLEVMVEDYTDIAAAHAELSALEHRGDQLSRELGNALNRSFVTPFDREDIHSLISGLDDILDLIEEVAEAFVLFRVAAPTEPARAQVAIVVAQCQLLHDALSRLRGFKGLGGHWAEIHRLENDGDRIERAAIAELFSNGIDPVELVKRKAIYDLLEECIDACDHVAKILDRIVVKHA
ncbi:MAG: DUF47 family protein [Actinomycetota bacterium]|nr:DUF47 family protein [Actinomycetota bacterium]